MKWTSAAAVLLALAAETFSNPLPDHARRSELALKTIATKRLTLDSLRRRAICTEEELDQLVEDTEDDTGPAPTTGGEAGLGAEFETAYVQIEAEEGCSFEDKNKAKGRIISGRKGDNWQLTADIAGHVTAEYQIIGTSAKIGKNLAVPAAEAIAADAVAWDPRIGQEVEIEDNPCKWTVTAVSKSPNSWKFSPQLTVPMPLEAINDIIAKSVAAQDSPFLGNIKSPNWVSVTKEFFQSSPGGIAKETVTEDLLGFFSLLVSYAKVARAMDEFDTLHHLLPIMPRTDFVGQLNQVSSKLQGKDLYDLVTKLACYTNGATAIDTKFCTGDVSSPSPNGQMDGQTFTLSTDTESKSLKVKDWINGLSGDSASDGLVELDKFVGGSFGAFGSTTEKMVDSDRQVPLYEFRRLPSILTGQLKDWTQEREDAVIAYHRQYASAPNKLKKRQSCEIGLLERKCRIETGVVDKPVGHADPYLTITMYDENYKQVGDNWGEYLPVDKTSEGIGGLGPLIYATIVNTKEGSAWPYDVNFEYGDQSFNFLGNCTLMSDSNLGQDQMMKSQKCEFDCRG